jgi:hypothetical protein
MDPDEFRRALCRAVHLDEGASEYAILAEVEPAYHFWLLNRPVPGDDLGAGSDVDEVAQ